MVLMLQLLSGLVTSLGTLWLARALWWLWQAEQGRQHDLVRRTYRDAPACQVGILVAVETLSDLDQVEGLHLALSQQEEPLEQIQLHIVSPLAPAELAKGLIPGPTVRWWQVPADDPVSQLGNAVSLQLWGAQRLLASQPPDLFLFLEAGDRVRPDFIRHLIHRSFDYPVLQCYRASRPIAQEGFWLHWQAIEDRLISRIHLAGGSRGQLGALLQASGLAIQPSLLEKIPPASGWAADWSGYTLKLLSRGVSIGWAPHAVVFQAPQPGWQALLRHWSAERLQALALSQKTGLSVASIALSKPSLPLVMGWLSLSIKGLSLIAFWGWLAVAALDSALAVEVALIAGAVHLLSLLVARLPMGQQVQHLLGSVILGVIASLTLPVALMQRHQRHKAAATRLSHQTTPSTRLNEALPVAMTVSEGAEEATPGQPFLDDPQRWEPDDILRARQSETDGLNPLLQSEAIHEVTLSYGERQVACQLTQHCQWDQDQHPHYVMTLVYKGHRFQTQAHPTALAAYDELRHRLLDRGFRMSSCGACAYFYQDDPHLPLARCAFGIVGPEGQPTSADQDGNITLATPICSQYEARFNQDNEPETPALKSDPSESATVVPVH